MFDAALVAAVTRAPNIDKVARGHIQQTEIVKDLSEGHYESAITVAEAFKDAVLGIGVAEAVDGEIVAFDGAVWRVPVDGIPVIAEPQQGLPFAVVATGGTSITEQVAAGTDFAGLTTLIDDVLKAAGQLHDHMVAAIRVDGTFTEVQFAFGTWAGTMVGFRFPGCICTVLRPIEIAVDTATGG